MGTSSTDEPEFEEVVSALLKVDPSGLSGKHKKAQQDDDQGDDEPDD